VFFAEWQYGEDFAEAMHGDITALGAFRNTFLPVVAPWLDSIPYVLGLYGGEDARQPGNLLGLDPMGKRAAQILNAAGYAGNLPFGMGQDANGNFRPFGELALPEAAMKVFTLLGRPPVDLYAGIQARQTMHLEQLLIEEHPEWDEDTLARTVNELWAADARGEEVPEILLAEKAAFQESITGPDFVGLPEQLRPMFGGPAGAALRVLSPLRVMSEPAIKTQLRDGEVPVETTDEYDVKALKGRPYDTLDAAILAAQDEDWWDIGSDTGMKDASRVYQAIAHFNLDAPITIYGKTYSNESLKDGVMSESQRYDVASLYLNSQGLTRGDLDAYYEAQTAMEAAHPDLAAYHTFKDYIKNYEGETPEAKLANFVNTAVQTSPSYARYMQQTSQGMGVAPGTPDYYALGDSADAYYALEGKRSGIYDPLTLPDKGSIPGQPAGMSFGALRALETNADAAASSGGESTSYEGFVGDVQKSVDDLYNAQQMLDTWFPGAGYVAGVTYFEKGTYQALKDAGYNAPDKGDIAYEYNDWLLSNATTTDPSVKAFLDQREGKGGSGAVRQENVTPEMILDQRGGSVNVVDPATVPRTDGRINTTGMLRATPNQPIAIFSQPSLNQPTPLEVPPGVTIYVIEQHGDWAYVVAPGNQVGWIPSAALNRA
jgi:hypothetical protein